MAGELEGRVAIVTGGGSGLGQAICLNLAGAGACVCVADVDSSRAEKTVALLQEQKRDAFAMAVDVSDPESCNKAVTDALSQRGDIDILVNSAGIDVTLPMTDISIDQWRRVLGVNLDGAFFMAKSVAPFMIERRRGHIVNIVSTAAKRAWPNATAYQASKWGLLGLSYALHSELRGSHVKVTAVIPGGMRTPFLLERFPEIDASTLQDPATVAETVRFVLCQPAESVIPEVMVLPMQEPSWP
jgi:NAD(P)-dependent dehydrogenase (short-subunit alcohol dehydrogenase family)